MLHSLWVVALLSDECSKPLQCYCVFLVPVPLVLFWNLRGVYSIVLFVGYASFSVFCSCAAWYLC